MRVVHVTFHAHSFGWKSDAREAGKCSAGRRGNEYGEQLARQPQIKYIPGKAGSEVLPGMQACPEV